MINALYKQTKSGPIPESWNIVLFKEVFKGIKRKNSQGLELILTASGEYGLIAQGEFFTRTIPGESIQNYFLINKGEFAYNRSFMKGYPCGAIKRLDRYEEGAVSPIYICFSLINVKCDSDYYKYLFDGSYLNHQLRTIVKIGSRAHGLLNLRLTDFFNMELPLPPLIEQRKIAEILSTIDEAIEKTDAIIQEVQQLKKGVTQKLFTEGIGHTRFEETRIGRIPEEWEWHTLQDLAAKKKGGLRRGPFGGAIKKSFFVPSGYKVYEQRNVIYNDFQLGNYYIDESKYNELSDFEIHPNDLLISCSGTIGKIVLVPDYIEKGIINQALLKITLNNEKMTPEYFRYLFESDDMQKRLFRYRHGSAMNNLVPLNEMKRILIATPPISEQHKIIDIVSKVNCKIEQEHSCKAELERLRKGLMQVLLTGAVRVKV